jgi:hypothetical protein
MRWSWADVQSAPAGVVEEAFRLMEDSQSEEAKDTAAAELYLKSLKAAKEAKGRR